MKLSELKDEEAIKAIGKMIEPIGRICTDKEIQKAYKNKASTFKVASMLCERHSHDVMICLAALEGKDVKDFHCNLISLPAKLIEVLNDEDCIELFTSAGIEIPD